MWVRIRNWEKKTVTKKKKTKPRGKLRIFSLKKIIIFLIMSIFLKSILNITLMLFGNIFAYRKSVISDFHEACELQS
jgi:hypothetical protein